MAHCFIAMCHRFFHFQGYHQKLMTLQTISAVRYTVFSETFR